MNKDPKLPVFEDDFPEIPVLEDKPIQPVQWLGDTPTNCDIGGETIGNAFVDGATKYGPWGFMCPSCHARYGYGLGTGRGQLYQLQPDGKWLKTKG
jgi:hypothetical protein